MKTFIELASEMFPEVLTTGTITRQQIVEVCTQNSISKPRLLMANKVGRGLYQFPNGSETPVALIQPKQKSNPVKEVMETQSLVPLKDANFVPFGNFSDLELIIKSDMFYPTYVYGPTGNGKSTMVEQICAKHNKSLIRVNLNMMTDEEQLIGSKTLVDGNVEIVEGPVLLAMRNGTQLLLDEIDAGSANTLLCLQPILEGKPYFFKLKNEIIIPKEGFNIIATANTKGKGSEDGRYIGTNVLNEAFLERFAITLEQDYPPASVELKIIKNLMNQFNCLDEEYAKVLVKWAEAIRKTYDDGGVDELITTRRMVHIIRAFSVFKNKTKAVELCCNRFDNATKLAFMDLLDKLTDEPVEVIEQEETVSE